MTARAIALDNLRALSADELVAHLREQRGQLFQVRLQQTIGQVENHREIRAIRREIARTMTVQVEYKLAAERGEPVPAPAAPARRGRRAAAAAVEASPAPSRRRRSRAAAQPTADEPAVDVTDIEVERPQAETTDTTGAAAADDDEEWKET
ncbi:MAG TPA: 50S ribosomal protein L29 [Candidatus Dormibacteraeota bacterium]|nr:50S ribosomal protein L29 [Candidatus Dormibacteraeota bacterium]